MAPLNTSCLALGSGLSWICVFYCNIWRRVEFKGEAGLSAVKVEEECCPVLALHSLYRAACAWLGRAGDLYPYLLILKEFSGVLITYGLPLYKVL